jgi:hypothetical protein
VAGQLAHVTETIGELETSVPRRCGNCHELQLRITELEDQVQSLSNSLHLNYNITVPLNRLSTSSDIEEVMVAAHSERFVARIRSDAHIIAELRGEGKQLKHNLAAYKENTEALEGVVNDGKCKL